MKRGIVISFLGLVLVSAAIAQQDLKSRADAASGIEKSKLALQYAEQQVKAADKDLQDGKDEQGSAELKEVAQYAQMAADASVQANKRQKETEISLRKIAYQLNQIQHTRPQDEQDELKRVITVVDNARSSLLESMFDKKKGR